MRLIVTSSLSVSQGYFAAAVAFKSYVNHEGFNDKLTKREAKKILKNYHWEHGFHGHTGERDSDEYYGTDNAEEWQEIYDKAFSWVQKNYPNLKK